MNFDAIKDLFSSQFGLEIQNLAYYETAFTHSSYVNEKKREDLNDNERIEFLGDAVIELLVSNYLYAHYPELREGDLSRFRARIVCEESLSKRCVELGLDRLIRLGKGEEANGGRKRPGLLCDLYEAVCGAVYKDLGLEAVEVILADNIYPKIKAGRFDRQMDPKTALQEELQKNGEINLSYDLLEESGPAHNRVFRMAVSLDGQVIGEGQGQSKKAAQQAAAQEALDQLAKKDQ
ncbi:ribonuclease III [Aerococcus sanguinicola]|uniref:Ribonuclease 3 n=1 Tax=Aerococcus sanguinicola TaxID=119206 RepID=A0A109REL7_9LACT|nr:MULTISPECIES: ribonuclease III [Aerococcus]AMB93566.1 ribonuclease III [Aerococcus sanguinicola]MDK7050784.1 ribonuclease III [Aerococcus sanguinicola]OFT97409.1 ribonuclease III [Aerococcus sp. HMSC23C02]PKZ21705.1 ribonuclease III [Aerococcus sanguinicola]